MQWRANGCRMVGQWVANYWLANGWLFVKMPCSGLCLSQVQLYTSFSLVQGHHAPWHPWTPWSMDEVPCVIVHGPWTAAMDHEDSGPRDRRLGASGLWTMDIMDQKRFSQSGFPKAIFQKTVFPKHFSKGGIPKHGSPKTIFPKTVFQ